MQSFQYDAVDPTGKRARGEVEAETRSDVVDYLHERNLTVVDIREKLGFSVKELGSLQIGGVPLSEKVIFMKQLATMLSAGLPLLQALEILAGQVKNPVFRTALQRVVHDIEGGSKLSQAFAKHSDMFSEIEINVVAAGEESGNLVEMLQELAENLEKERQFKSKVKGALIYPMIIFVAIIVVVTLLMMFMIPAVEELFSEFDAKLPLLTQILVSVSNFVGSYWWAILIIIIGLGLGYRYYRSTPSGKEVTDRIYLKIPVFGKINIFIQLAEMTRLLAMLLKSGLPILRALEITSRALSNVHYSFALTQAKAQVEKGVPLAVPLSKNKDIPVLLSRLVATGEETGNLEKVLADVHNYYQAEVDQITANLTKIMEPVILLIVGVVVGIVAFAVYMPIYQIGSAIT